MTLTENTKMPNPQYQTQMEANRSPLLSTSTLTNAGLSLQAAFLMASSANAGAAKTNPANENFIKKAKLKP